MEHRCGERVAITVPALVGIYAGGWVPSTIRNVSAGGLFIETSARVFRNAFLVISTHLNCPDTMRRYRFPALVVHRCDDGVGLMFAESQELMVEAVRDLKEVGAELYQRRYARLARMTPRPAGRANAGDVARHHSYGVPIKDYGEYDYGKASKEGTGSH